MKEEEKVRKLVVAGTVTAVTLLFILLIFGIYQMISVSVKNNKIEKLENEIAYYQKLIDEGELDIAEKYATEWYLEQRAWELGLKYPK